MTDTRKRTGNVGSESRVAVRRALDLAPGKRTLTEGLQPSLRLWQPLDHERTKAAGYSAVDLAVGNDVGMPADVPNVLIGDTLHADARWPTTTSGERGEVRSPIVGDVDTQCVGEAFARDLSDEALEQTIEYLVQRRDRPDVAPTDRGVAIENLAVLAVESARRGRSSGAVDRDAVRTLIRDATAGVQELASVLQQLAGNRDGLRNHPITERFLEQAVDHLTWVIDTASQGFSYMDLAASTGGQARVALLGMAATRAHAAHVGLAILGPWCAFL